MPSQEMQAIIQVIRAQGALEAADPDIVAARKRFEAVAQFMPTPPDVKVEQASADGVPGEWITAPGAADGATIYYLHGGGYTIGSPLSHRELVSRLSRVTGARAFSLDYRLAPENKFPAAIDDAVTGYRWLLKQGARPESTVIGGDSAGGGLTLATLLTLRDAGDPLPAAAVLLSPWTDLEGNGESMKTRAELDPMIKGDLVEVGAAQYYGDASPRDPRVSPIHADLSGLPPTLIHVGDWEVLLDDSTRLAAKARAGGVDVTLKVWPEMIHVFQFFGAAPEARQAVDEIGAFIKSHIASKAPSTAAGATPRTGVA